MEQIKVKAMCVFRNQDHLFVIEGFDPGTGKTYYRPPGGKIEFGEAGRECVVREIREELGAEIKDIIFLGIIENIFEFNSEPRHEVVLIFQANFVDIHFDNANSVEGWDCDKKFVARWMPLDDFRSGKAILRPEGLLSLLEKEQEYPEFG